MPLPVHMRADDPAAADPARRRLLRKSRVSRFPSLSLTKSADFLAPPTTQTSDVPADDILITDAQSEQPPSSDKDVFRWAVLYENQRGITLFSTPLYSPLSLLPSDPQPFTVPLPLANPHHLPNLSLDNYPLPDGTWRWLSSAWMVDMRSELGQVQPDGFEYNWFFRDNHWHANIGTLSAGAWVRRRRWVRLMMRPAIHPLTHNNTCRLPPSPSRCLPNLDHYDHPWSGTELDWFHVLRLLKHLGRDGRKLELWRIWLAPYMQSHTSDSKGKEKQLDLPSSSSQCTLQNHLSDVVPDGNPPSLAHLIALLENHAEALLRSFIYPDSRAQFVRLIAQAGLAKDLQRGLGHTPSTADVGFWSYADSLDKF